MTSSRVNIGVVLKRNPAELGEWLADAAAFDSAGADALWVDLERESTLDTVALVAALAALTSRALLVTPPLPAGGLATIQQLSRNRHRTLTGEAEHWLTISLPDSRAAWQARLVDAAQQGVHGILVPADARLLDLLRNPGDPGERADLQLAVG
jgi:hypothetical protein